MQLTQRKTGRQALVRLSLCAAAAWLVVGCAKAPLSVGAAGFTTMASGVYLKGDSASYAQYSTGEYLPGALPNVKDFNEYAGHVVIYHGARASAGGCVDRDSARIEMTHVSIIRAGQKAKDEEPNGKLDEVLVSRANKHSAGVLAIVSASYSDSMAIQLLVQDLAQQTVPDKAIDEARLRAAKNEAMSPDVCDRRFIRSAILTEATSKTYENIGTRAKIGAFNVDIDSNWYRSTGSFHRDLYVRVETLGL
jgi:hypothetical protein